MNVSHSEKMERQVLHSLDPRKLARDLIELYTVVRNTVKVDSASCFPLTISVINEQRVQDKGRRFGEDLRKIL